MRHLKRTEDTMLREHYILWIFHNKHSVRAVVMAQRREFAVMFTT